MPLVLKYDKNSLDDAVADIRISRGTMLLGHDDDDDSSPLKSVSEKSVLMSLSCVSSMIR